MLNRTPLHCQIAERLRQMVALDYQSGDRFPSQNELAKMFDVSPPTAREAVGLLVQEGLLERRFGSGTYVTTQAGDQTVGVVVELDISHPQTSWFYLRLTQMIRHHVEAAGYRTRLYVGRIAPYAPEAIKDVSLPELLEDMEKNQLAAVLVVAADQDQTASLAARFSIPVIPTVAVNGVPLVDHATLAQAGVRHLIDAGCQRIAMIEHVDANSRRPSDTMAAVANLLQQHGMVVRDDWLVGAVGDGFNAGGAAAFRSLWGSGGNRPDGLLVLDDVLYSEIAPLLNYNNIRVPDDLTVVSLANKGRPQQLIPHPVCLVVDPDLVAETFAQVAVATLSGQPLPEVPKVWELVVPVDSHELRLVV